MKNKQLFLSSTEEAFASSFNFWYNIWMVLMFVLILFTCWYLIFFSFLNFSYFKCQIIIALELQGSCDVMGKAMDRSWHLGPSPDFATDQATWTWVSLLTPLGFRFLFCIIRGMGWTQRALTALRIHYFINWIGPIVWNLARYIKRWQKHLV